MNGERAVENDGPRHTVPDEIMNSSTPLHCLERDIAERVHGKVQREKLDGVEFKQTAYALDRDSRKAALARFLRKAVGEPSAEAEYEQRLAA